MRDPSKLRAFELADALVLRIYAITRSFPKEELFCLTPQIRRAAVSIPSNIVEGCARESKNEYVHFLDVAYASCCEVCYQVSLAHRLDYIPEVDGLNDACQETAKVLNALIRSLRANNQSPTT
ncbi:MAG: four helix bundle protein [bacterium]|nr:four helix bundle protein [bacterium]